MKAQRLRFRFRLTAVAIELRHRDIIAAWENAARSAGLDLSYSTGKRPAPQISLAAPLPHGVTSECEVVDLYLESSADPADALVRIAAKMQPGVEPISVEEIGVGAQALQASLRWAEYEVDVPAEGISEDDVSGKIECLLSQSTVPAEYKREAKTRAYDLRPLILELQLTDRVDDTLRLKMILRAEQENTARADQVVLALGLPQPLRIHRKRLGFVTVPPVVVAYRRAGEEDD
jgi:radical SAM-linked protein